MDNQVLKKLQMTEIEILCVIDQFCIENDIPYTLAWGSAIGAVRHKGFIPWDDDVDICMDRYDYERFIDLWRAHPQDGYYLQDTREDTNSTINHSKVMKENTFYGSQKAYEAGEKQGVFVDIFPWDRVPDRKYKILKTKLWAAVRMVYTRGYPFTSGSRFLSVLSKCMLMLPAKLKASILRKANRQVVRYQNLTDHYHYMDFSCPEMLNKRYQAEVMKEFTRVPFETAAFSLTKAYDEMLTVTYGDYMKLPPEEERVCKHMQEILDFGD